MLFRSHATSELVKAYFPFSRLAATADNAAELAEKIIEEAEDTELIFFCGDLRRDELPERLREANFDVDEVVVYQTIATPHKMKKSYNGILFFSPSGVNSFFEMNHLPPGTPLFAIGNTTATAIRKRCGNPVFTPDHPDRDELVEMVMNYFS